MPQVPLTPQLAVEQQALTERLRRARHFRTLPPVAMRTLVDVARVRSMRAGEVLWRAGDAGTGFTFVDRGLVMISTPRSNGGAAVLGVFGPDDCVGISAVLARAPYPADAVALAPDTRVLVFPAAAVLAAVEGHRACADLVQAAVTDHTAALRMKIEILSAGTVPARVAAFLLYLGSRFGHPHAMGSVSIPVMVTRAQIAQIVAARPETVIRAFAAWRRQRIVATGPEGFELKAVGRLHAIAAGE
jgi:CRP-like cAMP-binding protein